MNKICNSMCCQLRERVSYREVTFSIHLPRFLVEISAKFTKRSMEKLFKFSWIIWYTMKCCTFYPFYPLTRKKMWFLFGLIFRKSEEQMCTKTGSFVDGLDPLGEFWLWFGRDKGYCSTSESCWTFKALQENRRLDCNSGQGVQCYTIFGLSSWRWV